MYHNPKAKITRTFILVFSPLFYFLCPWKLQSDLANKSPLLTFYSSPFFHPKTMRVFIPFNIEGKQQLILNYEKPPQNQNHLKRYALRELEITISNRSKPDRLQTCVPGPT